MLITDIIAKKRDGLELKEAEIEFFVQNYTNGIVADYQASALLMAIFIRGMTKRETAALTLSMANSGERINLDSISGIKVDKHSTGGVGDKTTLIAAPMAAALGVKVAKMSGRGLGHTGGTVDKLESIPNFCTKIEIEKLIEIVNKIGICVTGQTGNLAPADKKIYALRDVTATVNSIPLIASSVMSKKIAAGADCILLDVKMGSGAFVKTEEDAVSLAKEMVAIGENVGKKTVALITNMDVPLGNNIGNTLEIIEAIETLQGKGPRDLTELCVVLCANMLELSQKGSYEECVKLARNTIEDKSAYYKLIEMVAAQGGDTDVIYDTTKLKNAKFEYQVKAQTDGFLSHTDTEEIGMASLLLGAGRIKKEDAIDYSAGIVLKKKYGDTVKKGETLALLYSDDEKLFEASAERLIAGTEISSEKPEEQKLIYSKITKEDF
jgi:pyrimidine-nucleoside phosphorylase